MANRSSDSDTLQSTRVDSRSTRIGEGNPLRAGGIALRSRSRNARIWEDPQSDAVLPDVNTRLFGAASSRSDSPFERLFGIHEEWLRSLAEDLHESVIQSLVGAMLRLETARQFLSGNGSDPSAKEEIDAAIHLTQASLASARTIVNELHPAALDDFGLIPALTDLVTESSRNATHTEIEFLCSGSFERGHPLLEVGVFRIAQQLLACAVDTLACERLAMKLDFFADFLRLAIRVSSTCFDFGSVRRCHKALAEIRERAWLLGGLLVFDVDRRKELQAVVEIPLG